MAKEFDAPMFHNGFFLSVYIPKQAMDANELIKTTRLQSLWISNFKKKFGNYDYIKGPCQMAQNYIVTHYERDKNESKIPSSFGQRSHYALSRSLYSQKLQEKSSSIKRKRQTSLWIP
jgi:hypothetical protein